ncbi:MAG: transporter substrate-binding domain-containing protein [Rhodobacterales bacterium]|nr:transporter substrate-binding domain-containing protein [Rhodobacterales bacterium]
MKISARSLCIGCTAAFLGGGAAHAQEACTTYTVVAGDNLRYIARSAYGDADLFRVIYNANVAVIGEKADLIEIGAKLVLPCDPAAPVSAAADPVSPTEPTATALATGVIDPAKQPLELVPELPVEGADTAAPAEDATAGDATVEVTAAAPEASAPETTAPETTAAEPAAAATIAPVRMVTGNGYAPFADEMLPGGGMFTQLVEMAIFRADPTIPYNMTFINDWQAHIDALLPSQAYDLSFPWIKPDCSGATMLSAGDQLRCDDFVFSAPFYEIVDGFFALNDSPLVSATVISDFEGKRICRPEGYTTGVLESLGLAADKVELTQPVNATDCFEALAAGKVDLVSIDAEVGDSAIAQIGMTGMFTQNPHLMALQSLHVIAHKSNPRAMEMIVQLDSGLIEMYESGEWYDIVSSALSKTALQQ